MNNNNIDILNDVKLIICLKKYFETNIKSLSEVEKKDFAKNALKELLVWDL